MSFFKDGGALVTGGSQRIGKALAVALAGRGMNVAVQYRKSKDQAQETVAELCAFGVKAASLQADFLNEDETDALVGEAGEALGCRLNVLVNNASVFERDHVRTASRREWDLHIETNLRAPFVLTQKFAQQAPPAEKDGEGETIACACVINIVDQRVVRPTSEFATYTVSKMGLWALTQSSAVALAPEVRVNAIGPGPTLIASRQSAGHFARQRRGAPLGRGARAGEVVAAMDFFLDSPSATGQLVCLDGGRNLIWKGTDSTRRD